MQAPGARDLTESQEFKTNARLLWDQGDAQMMELAMTETIQEERGVFCPQPLTRAMRLSTSKEQHQAGENRLSAHAMP